MPLCGASPQLGVATPSAEKMLCSQLAPFFLQSPPPHPPSSRLRHHMGVPLPRPSYLTLLPTRTPLLDHRHQLGSRPLAPMRPDSDEKGLDLARDARSGGVAPSLPRSTPSRYRRGHSTLPRPQSAPAQCHSTMAVAALDPVEIMGSDPRGLRKKKGRPCHRCPCDSRQPARTAARRRREGGRGGGSGGV
ncbi:hypothetical protein OsJ_15303 [Oryza sativa Japonica Group]|uniref:Uncharacterized protein n=1 Tax=Oryza sativa subsp. japonica TaxID=39947 RepID=B9FFW4_ORYSJ|nr:hypothetical protein OsJ_15303 [Oryza sativa Japonica Group]